MPLNHSRLDAYLTREPDYIQEGGSYFYNGFPVTVDLINDDDTCKIKFESGRIKTVDISDLEFTDYNGE